MDNGTEKRVWQRVYGQAPMPPRQTPAQRRQIGRCLERTEANLRDYESRTRDPVYGEAFSRLARESAEHCKMLRRMLE